MSTSTRLSLRYTTITTLIVLVFAIVINGLFFSSRYRSEHDVIHRDPPAIHLSDDDTVIIQKGNRNLPFERMIMVSQEEFDALNTHPSWIVDDLVRYDDSWLLVSDGPVDSDMVRMIDSTSAVQSQIVLIKISLFVLIAVALLTYFVSLWLTRYALRDIKTIADTVGRTDINSLDEKISLPHLPADDEIQTIATAINNMTDTLHGQVSQMKRFVGNLSHEIKTPLMTMLSQIDVSLRKKDYQTGLERNRTTVQQMNDLVTMMTELHQAGQYDIACETVSIEPLIHDVREDVQ
ncbi:MAG: hypothetical protein H6766_05525 [Candidatus Peribacteria bacterium]|nr:MAG: hypothetical protein H6766_05525 [Candidatus Peribacteria bacterium]